MVAARVVAAVITLPGALAKTAPNTDSQRGDPELGTHRHTLRNRMHGVAVDAGDCPPHVSGLRRQVLGHGQPRARAVVEHDGLTFTDG